MPDAAIARHVLRARVALADRMPGRATRPHPIVFLHIPKCAGSAVSAFFKACLGSSRGGRTIFIHDHAPEAERRRALERMAGARYVAGHIGWDTVEPVLRVAPAFVFTVLREPEARLLSLHNFMLTVDDGLNRSYAATTAAFLDPASTAGYFTDNFMVRQLAGALGRRPDWPREGPALLDDAKAHLMAMDAVAFQATLDRDIARIARVLRLPQPTALGARNVTSARAGAAGLTAFAPSDRVAVERLIDWDRRLWDFAAARFGAG